MHKRFPIIRRESLDVVEQTAGTLVLREQPYYVEAAIFGILSLVIGALVVASMAKFDPLMLLPPIFFLGVALHCSVETTIAMEKGSRVLRVKRRLGKFVFVKRYPVDEIQGVLSGKSREGNALKLQLSSGKQKSLTLAGYSYPDKQAGLLNHLVFQERKRSISVH